VVAGTATDRDAAAALAAELALPLLPPATDPAATDVAAMLLVVAGTRLALQRPGARAPGPVAVDFGSGGMRHRRRGGGNELLGRAVGVGRAPGLRVLDATAGLGRDAFVLADLGCEVLLCERHPVVARLLHAGMAQARDSGDPWLATRLARMQLLSLDPRQAAPGALAGIEVIYLDPMFTSTGGSAAAKRDMTALQLLLSGAAAPEDAPQLLEWALAQDVARVVVKRPLKGAPLGGRAPSHCIRGRAVRYDVHVRRALRA